MADTPTVDWSSCTECPLVSRSPGHLSKHLLNQHGTKKFSCKKCALKMCWGAQMAAHRYYHSSSSSQSARQSCSECQKVLPSYAHCRIHKRKLHGIVDTVSYLACSSSCFHVADLENHWQGHCKHSTKWDLKCMRELTGVERVRKKKER